MPNNSAQHHLTGLRAWPGRRSLVTVLLLASWLCQFVALRHAVDHTTAGSMHRVSTPHTGHVPAGPSAAHDPSHIWGHDADSAVCDLLDDLLACPSVAGAPLAMAAAPAEAEPFSTAKPKPQPRLARASYQARGPPAA